MEDSDNTRLDRRDRRILAALQEQGRMTNVELARQVGMSESPCFRRLRQLEASGVIHGYTAQLDQRMIGLPVTAYVRLSIDKHDDQFRQEVHRRILEEPHIVECHMMTGSSDFLLKLVARSIDHFSELTTQGLLKWPGVRDIESQFSLRTLKRSSPLPVLP